MYTYMNGNSIIERGFEEKISVTLEGSVDLMNFTLTVYLLQLKDGDTAFECRTVTHLESAYVTVVGKF